MRIQRYLLATALTAFVTPALAADVVYEEPPVVVVDVGPLYSWTGFYIGGQLGVAFNTDAGNVSYNPSTGTVNSATAFSGGSGGSSDAAFIGGLHVGYDYQFANNVLLGAIADINYIDASSIASYTLGNAVTGYDSFGISQDINFVGTVRAKLGVAVNRFAVYATGGLAYADTDNKYVSPNTFRSALAGFGPTVSSDSDDFGYAVGAGVDYLVTPNLSLGLEYLYTDLGDSHLDVSYANAVTSETFSTHSSNSLDFSTVWAKASYRFN